jgi:hypothetical protein
MTILDESLIQVALNQLANFYLICWGAWEQSGRPRCRVSDVDDDLEVLTRTGRVVVGEQLLSPFRLYTTVIDEKVHFFFAKVAFFELDS